MFTIGLIGGILSTLVAMYTIIYGFFDSTLGDGSSSVTSGGLIGLAFGIVGIVAASTSRRNRKLSSILMIIAGIGGAFFVNFSPIASVILIIAGLIGLLKKERKVDVSL